MNVLLVVLDSVRAKNTSIHGYNRDTTPFLDALTSRSITYTEARAPGNWSLPSHSSMFSGYYPPEHGVFDIDDKLDPQSNIFSDLSDNGHSTAVVSGNSWLTTMDVGLKDPFSEIIDANTLYPFAEALSPDQLTLDPGINGQLQYFNESLQSNSPVRALINGLSKKLSLDYPRLLPDDLAPTGSAHDYVELLLDWIDHQKGDWAACLNLMDAHLPYTPDSEYDIWSDKNSRKIQNYLTDHKWQFYSGSEPWWKLSALESLYDGSIRQMDAALNYLYSELDNRDITEETIVIITSDHGECFGETSNVRGGKKIAAHGVSMIEELLHVPLIVDIPGDKREKRIDDIISLIKIPEMISDAVNNGSIRPNIYTDEQIYAFSMGLVTPDREHADYYCEDPEYLLGEEFVKYTEDREKLKKTTDIYGPKYERRLVETISENFSTPSRKTFEEHVESVGVNIGGSGLSEVSDSTKDRLEELGYL
ncbi:sulfatase-like hydrolase/transferase [Haloarcula amylolytica]|uniref:sulfatase-like hydrolase/transferase n=1 Tax=Haloarcula amylolytica TaxID=396317 RepID=UPI003C75A120